MKFQTKKKGSCFDLAILMFFNYKFIHKVYWIFNTNTINNQYRSKLDRM